MCMDLAMRDLVAGGAEVVSSIQHFDGIVLLSGCDNIVPGTLLAAARLNIPATCVTGGPMLAGRLNGKPFAQCDVTEFCNGAVAAGKASEKQIAMAEYSACPSMGACPTMGTANTMQILAEALGMTLPYSSTIPAVYTDKMIDAKNAGVRIVQMVHEGLKPSDIITKESIENAIHVDMAIGGSTNAVMHLIALGNELGIDVTLDDFQRISRQTPCFVNIRPSGQYTVDLLHQYGGVPAICRQMESMLHTDCKTVSGLTLGEILKDAPSEPNFLIRSLKDPVTPDGGLNILYGNLAPNGSVIRSSTVKPNMHHFIGTAKVYSSDAEAHRAIIHHEAGPGNVIVVRDCGPVGAPGMVEIMKATEAIVNLGLDDSTALITDGRFSGFCHGPIVGHVSPEAVLGGPIGLVEDGDEIEIDIDAGKLELHVDEETLKARRARWKKPEPRIRKGFMRTYALNCLPPEKGAAMQKWQ